MIFIDSINFHRENEQKKRNKRLILIKKLTSY